MLGTAQFGMAYGIANQTGDAVALNAAQTILHRCQTHDVDMLDTAIGYGAAEDALGQLDTAGLQIVSKLPSLENCDDGDALLRLIEASLARLGRSFLDGLLLHRPEELLSDKGAMIAKALMTAKERGLVKTIGLSVYGGADLPRYCDSLDLDIIQAPYNILNQKFATDGWDQWLKDRDIALHIRSVFLQGLLLQRPENRSSIFHSYEGVLSRFDKMCQDLSLSAAELCWRFALTTTHAERLVFGVQSLSELDEILALPRTSLSQDMSALNCDDEQLTNPVNWGAL